MLDAFSQKREAVHDQYAADTTKNVFDGRYSSDSVIVTLSAGIAIYNCLELTLLIPTTFKKWRGLYFWSLNLCNLGILLYAVGMVLGYFDLCVLWLSMTIIDVGWGTMITCQSLVLYSRLGLILENRKILRFVKWMIIVDSIILVPLVNALNFASTYSRLPGPAAGYFYIEHVQLIWFTLQEMIISGLYVWKTLAFLQVVTKENTRAMIWQLFTINVLIILMDIGLVVLEWLHYQLYQEAIKVFVYSVKLKLELNILSKLVDLVHAKENHQRAMSVGYVDASTIQGRAQADVKRELNQSDLSTSPSFNEHSTDLENTDKARDPKTDATLAAMKPRTTSIDHESIVNTTPTWSSSAAKARRASDVMYAEVMRAMTVEET